jgi:hypothetical protein
VQAHVSQKASLQGVKDMNETKTNEKNEKTKENRIQVIFFGPQKYEIEMKEWERLYRDTDGWLDQEYLIVRKIDESKFRK